MIWPLLSTVVLIAPPDASGAAGRAGPAWEKGARCVLQAPLGVSEKPGPKSKKRRLKPGAELQIVGVNKGFVETTTADIAGFAKAGELTRACKRIEPGGPATLTSPVTEAPPPPPAELATPTPSTPQASPPPPAAATSPSETLPPETAATSPAPAPVPAAPPATTLNPPPPVAVPPESQAAPAPTKATVKTKVAVMAVRGSAGIPAELIESLTNLIPQTLDDLGPFKGISSSDIQQMLAMESMKQALGCDSNSATCLAEIGGAIGADYMITGSCLLVSANYLLQFQLMNIAESRVETRVTREYAGGAKGLLDEVRVVTKLLVRDLLAAKSGTLALAASEEGATIKIDGAIVGVSPLAAFSVPGGMHTLEVEKEGFVRFTRDVEIRTNQQLEVGVLLLPSAEFKKKYTATASFWRTLSYAGLGAGAVGLAAGAALFGMSRSQAKSLRADILAYNAPDHSRTADEEARLAERVKGVARLDALSMTSVVVGLVATAVAAGLFFGGDDPHRFEIIATPEAVTP
ncbi:MAG: PEGA domain-containing protein [Deltaproteobacteria bacterium]|nr:PEGA domain-containing protein [Deltaproteobacteria bacterium]